LAVAKIDDIRRFCDLQRCFWGRRPKLATAMCYYEHRIAA